MNIFEDGTWIISNIITNILIEFKAETMDGRSVTCTVLFSSVFFFRFLAVHHMVNHIPSRDSRSYLFDFSGVMFTQK